MVSKNVEKLDPVYQLLYISAANHEFSEQELGELLATARVRNQEQGVSGVLIYHEGSFIQALEGRQEQVENIYKKISKDTRHLESRVLFRGDIPNRDFENWSMGVLPISNNQRLKTLRDFISF